MDCDISPCRGAKKEFYTIKRVAFAVSKLYIHYRFLKELQRLKNCKHIKTSNNPAWLPRRGLRHSRRGAGSGLAVSRRGQRRLGAMLGAMLAACRAPFRGASRGRQAVPRWPASATGLQPRKVSGEKGSLGSCGAAGARGCSPWVPSSGKGRARPADKL